MSKGAREYPLVTVYTATVYGQQVLVKRYASVLTPGGGAQFEDKTRPPEVDPVQAAGYISGEDAE